MFQLRYRLVAALVAVIAGNTSWAQTCVMSEPATSSCEFARTIPGTPGQHVVLVDASNAVGNGSGSCGFNVGRFAWFRVTPGVSGPITLSTCHPATTYDTVIEVFSGGDAGCNFMNSVACNDDGGGLACVTPCEPGSRASRVTFDAVAGQQYRIRVAAYNDNGAGCALCLGLIATIGEPCGDPPTNIGPCDAARELSSTPGSETIQIDVADAVVLPNEPPSAPTCTSATSLGHTVWFHVTPSVDGVMTFNTCNPGTTYDTVVEVFTGDMCGVGGFTTVVACNDDTGDPACLNACETFPRGSRVSFDGHAGQDYWIQVGSYNNNDAGCLDLCLEADFTLVDCATAGSPVVSITSPPTLTAGCACEPVQIVGSAYAPTEGFSGYTLEYRRTADAVWSPLAAGTNGVINGVLADWNTAGLPQGYYLLRLAAVNVCGDTSVATEVVFLDKDFDNVTWRYPPVSSPGGGVPVVAREVCLDGTVFESWCWHPATLAAHYSVEYRPVGGGGAFSPVDPLHPTYESTVVNDPFAQWDTQALAIPDGNYELRVTAQNDCGNVKTETRTVVVDNTPPIAQITDPVNCDYIEGLVNITGTATDANLDYWILEYTGGASSGWTTITSSQTTPVVSGLLAIWDTSSLPPCAYTLRLRVYDQAVLGCGSAVRQRAEYTTSVNVGFCGDFDVDDDGDVDLFDYGAFQGEFGGPNR